jgi:hypothetical protein
MMMKWIKQLDEIMRGDATRVSMLREGRIEMPVGGLSVVVILLAGTYGLCMGSFAAIRTAWSADGVTHDAIMQLIASAVKLPLLFFLTLLVTFPSLYVFNALVGSRLSMVSVARLLVAMLGVTLAVLASLGPIVVFFAVSTSSYPFIKLLNVAMAAIAGILGLAFLLRTMHRVVMVQDQIDFPPPVPAESNGDQDQEESDDSEAKSALDRINSSTGRKATAVFRIWVLVFAVVGAQMSWALRPFIGDPEKAFTWFRQRHSNFFLDVIKSISDLFGV